MNDRDQERSILGGALSYEFSDCSIAAADLSHRAVELIRNKREIFQTRLVGEIEPLPVLWHPVRYGYLGEQHDYSPKLELDGQPASLILIQPLEPREVPSANQAKKSWLKKVVTVTQTETKHFYMDDPMLCVQVGNNPLLPLVSFARRERGKCDYVQFGREMADDNFYVTIADDEGSRHSLVEAFRSLMTLEGSNGYSNRGLLSREQGEIMAAFIAEQTKANRAEIDTEYEHELVEKYMGLLKKNSTERQLTLVDGKNSQTGYYNVAHLIAGQPVAGRWKAALTLARLSGSAEDSAELLATLPGGVAVKLGYLLSGPRGKIEFTDSILVGEKSELIRQLLFYSENRPTIEDVETPENYAYDPGKLSQTDHDIARFLYHSGLLTVYERYENKHEDEVRHDIAISLTKLLESTETIGLPYPSSKPLHLGLHKKRVLDEYDRLFFGHFNLDALISQCLPEYRESERLLLTAADRLDAKGGEVEAVFKGVKIGKTLSDAVVSVRVERDGSIFRIDLSGRPVSMSSEPMKPILSLQIDPTLPRLGQAEETDVLLKDENIEELTNILLRLDLAA